MAGRYWQVATKPGRCSLAGRAAGAINFKLKLEKREDPEGGHRCVITLDGKYLPTKPF